MNKFEFDFNQIEKFKKWYKVQNEKHHINLPWIEENLPLPFSLSSISAPTEVHESLKKENYVDAYDNFFSNI